MSDLHREIERIKDYMHVDDTREITDAILSEDEADAIWNRVISAASLIFTPGFLKSLDGRILPKSMAGILLMSDYVEDYELKYSSVLMNNIMPTCLELVEFNVSELKDRVTIGFISKQEEE